MAGHHHGGAGGDCLPQDGVELVAAGGVEAGVRFVEQPQFGAAGDEARECRAPLLARAERPDRNVPEPTVDGESDHRTGDLVGSGTDRRTPERDVLRHGQVAVEAVPMTEQPDPRTDRLLVGEQVEPEDASGPARQREQPGAEAEQARLPGAVGAAEQHDLATVDAHRRTGEDGERPEDGDGIVQVDDGAVGRHGGRIVVNHDRRHATHRGLRSRRPPRGTDGRARRDGSSLRRVTDRIADLDDDVAVDEPVEDAVPTGSTEPPTPSATQGTRWARYREHRRTRVSKWDRPPDPKDWRYFVGTLGKVLIATGILMFGFVAYQLWGTGIETARAQNRLESAFEEAIAASTGDADETPATTVDDGDGDDGGDGDGVSEDPTDTGDPLPALPDPVPSDVVPGGVDLSDTAVDQQIPAIDRGDVIARLEIPRIDQDVYVVAGVTLDDLKDGPGHYPDTPLPGQLGNAAIAGHRTTYGAPFFDVDQLVAGDDLIVTTITGGRFVYRVTGVQVVSAADYWVVTTRDPNVAELTLTSCHPKYTARDRIVVHSVLVPELSSNVGLAEFYELDETSNEAIPGDDPTVVADEPPVTEPAVAEATASTVDPEDQIVATVDPDAGNDLVGGDDIEATVDEDVAAAPDDATGEAAAVPATTQPALDEVPSAPEPGTVEEPEQIDAFSQGWFDDDEAWPQIVLWGLALTVISLLAYQLSRRTRHDSIGFAAGIGPFLFCLYFFFQNVNRLLPPGL